MLQCWMKALMSTLHEIQEVLNEPNRSVKDPHSVRWKGLRNVTDIACQCYGAVLATLNFLLLETLLQRAYTNIFCSYKTAVATVFIIKFYV